jgi:hypothetical protein
MSRDLRKYARETQWRLLIGALVLLGVGVGLIYLIYGSGAAGMALFCLGAGLVPVGLILFVFWAADRILQRALRD